MAQIGHGHGSEFHLMRFMGHHRLLLENAISNVLNETGTFHWLDFGFSDPGKSVSGDQEILGISFLKRLDLPKDKVNTIYDRYSRYNIGRKYSWQNWDAVFMLNDTIYLVEAKAHVDELQSKNKDKNGGGSREEIKRFFKEQLENYNIQVSDSWLGDYYQFANRMATAAFVNNCGIKAKILYILFTDGFNVRELSKDGQSILSVDGALNTTKDSFLKAITREKETLGIQDNESVAVLLADPVFINARTGEQE